MDVRAKKMGKPVQPVRYLLSADRRLRKLSLKKLSERLKIAKRRPRPRVGKQAAAVKRPAARRPSMTGWAILGGVVLVVAAAALMPSAPASDGVAAATVEAPATPRAEAKTAPAKTAPAKTARPPAAPVERAPAPKTADVRTVSVPDGEPTAPAAPAASPVTITGCLEGDGDAYWLKDTSGADLPKTRSWKTGFLKRRSPRVEIVDASNALHLSTHLGERVAATGTMIDREMRARSLRRVAAVCN
jgi:hypothetical protein